MIKMNLIIIIGQWLVLMLFITGGTEKERVVCAASHGTTSTANTVGNEILNEEGNAVGSYAHVTPKGYRPRYCGSPGISMSVPFMKVSRTRSN